MTCDLWIVTCDLWIVTCRHSLDEVRAYSAPTQLFSASLHPSKSVFVCGGDDFIMYKFDYATGAELEACKGHFGPVHIVRFSPDGQFIGCTAGSRGYLWVQLGGG